MTRRAPLRAVVFDFDGTLVDSLPVVLAAIAHALEPFGGTPTMNLFAKLGGPPERFMPLLVPDPKYVPMALARMDEYHRAHNHRMALFDGAAPLLDALMTAKMKIAVWTGRDRLSTEILLGALGLDQTFDAVVCGDDLPTHKPDPAGMAAILRRLQVQPAETLFLGDADVDAQGGHACGVDTILVRHTRTVPENIAVQAWRSVSTPSDAFALVRQCCEGGA